MREIVDNLRSNAASNRRQADSAVRMAGPTALVGEALQIRKNADCLDGAADTIEAQAKMIEELWSELDNGVELLAILKEHWIDYDHVYSIFNDEAKKLIDRAKAIAQAKGEEK